MGTAPDQTVPPPPDTVAPSIVPADTFDRKAIEYHCQLLADYAQDDPDGWLAVQIYGTTNAIQSYKPAQWQAMADYIMSHDGEPGLNIGIPLATFDALGRRDRISCRIVFGLFTEADSPDTQPILPPNYIVESSPGHFHYVHFVPDLYPGTAKRFADAMKRATGAQGQGNIVNCVRVPGTRNHKYPNAPLVRIHKASDDGYLVLDDLRHRLKDVWDAPAAPPAKPLEGDIPSVDDMIARCELLRDAGPGEWVARKWTLDPAAYDGDAEDTPDKLARKKQFGYFGRLEPYWKSIHAVRRAYNDDDALRIVEVFKGARPDKFDDNWSQQLTTNGAVPTIRAIIKASNDIDRAKKGDRMKEDFKNIAAQTKGPGMAPPPPLDKDGKPAAPGPEMPKPKTAEELAKERAAAMDAAALPLVFFDEARNAPLQRYHIKGVIAEGATSSLFAPPKRMKSTIAMDMGVHLASAAEWRGHPIREKKGTLFFAFERHIQARQALAAYHIRDGLKNIPFAIVPKLVNILDPACVDLIKHAIDRAEQKWGIGCGLTVFDTWNKGIAFGGGNEDKAEFQNAAAAHLRRLLELFPALHCMTIGHTGKDVAKGERGSNATEGDRDVGFENKGENGKFALEVAYANALPEGEVITAFEGELIEIGKLDGEPVKSFIVSRQPVAMPTGKAATRKLTDVEQLALQALGEVLKVKGQLGGQIGGRSVALDEWKEQCIRTGAVAQDKNTWRDLGRRQVGLIAKGRILVLDNRVRLIGGDVKGEPGNVIPMPTRPGNAVHMPPK